jgi:hypothetical protein
MSRTSSPRVTRLTLASAFALTSLAATGCADEGPGSLVIPYQLGANLSCDEAEVSDVRAFLNDGDHEEEVDCEAGEVRLADITPGNYELTVQGLASDGAPILDNLDNDARTVGVVGDGAEVTIDPVLLTDAPARILISWNFGALNCTNANIDKFDVQVFEMGGTALLTDQSLDCDKAEADGDGYRTLPDPDREINGKVVGKAVIVATGTNVDLDFDPPGPGRSVKIDLSCDSAGCEEAP